MSCRWRLGHAAAAKATQGRGGRPGPHAQPLSAGSLSLTLRRELSVWPVSIGAGRFLLSPTLGHQRCLQTRSDEVQTRTCRGASHRYSAPRISPWAATVWGALHPGSSSQRTDRSSSQLAQNKDHRSTVLKPKQLFGRCPTLKMFLLRCLHTQDSWSGA